MALTLKTPGVFIEEISTIPPAVAPVANAIPVFIGFTQIALQNANNLTNIPTRITSMLEYIQFFGSGNPENFTMTITDTTATGPVLISRVTSVTLPTTSKYNLFYQMQLYFANGGGPCWIVSVGDYTTNPTNGAAKNLLLAAIDASGKIDEITLIVIPEATLLASASDLSAVYDHALLQCSVLKDRFVIMDVLHTTGDSVQLDADNFRNSNVSADNLKYGATYYPPVNSVLNFSFDEATADIEYFPGTPPVTNPFPNATPNKFSLSAIKTSNTAIYNELISKMSQLNVQLNPSGAIAGIYARVDRDRGVWKAPANVSMLSLIGPSINVTAAEQENLNVDATTGKSINVIRSFTGKGTLVWGARTLAGNDNEWRYVPVRRLFIMAEESIQKATEFVVFEPNDRNTWLRCKTTISNFLTNLWRDGALAGAVPKDAFFVKVGLGETMTADDILNGILNIEIGMAAVRPAEFIVLKFSHKLQES